MDVISYALSKKYADDRVAELTGLDLSSVNEAIQGKADSSYVEQKLRELENSSKFLIFEDLSELQTAYPSGHNQPIWIISENSWYYWNGDYTPPNTPTPPDTTPPNEITNLQATNTTFNSTTLTWTASTSTDVAGYEIYRGTTLLQTITTTTFTVTGLIASTEYTFTVKVKDTSNNLSNGLTVSVITLVQPNIVGLHLDRTKSDLLKTPSITFDEVIMEFMSFPVTSQNQYYMDMRTGIASGFVYRNTSELDQFSNSASFANGFYLNGVQLSAGTIDIPSGVRNSMRLVLSASGTDDVNIMSQNNNAGKMTANVYSVKFLNAGNLVAHYDMTTGTVNDQSGNGNHGVLTGGTWIV